MDKLMFIGALVLGLMLFLGASAALSVGVSPGDITFQDLMRGGYAEDTIMVSTSGNESLNVTITAREIAGGWMTFEPNSLVLDPNSAVSIKVTMHPPEDIPNGVYEGIVSVSVRPIKAASLGPGAGLAVGAAAAVKITANVTDIEIKALSVKDITITDVEEFQPTEIRVTAANTGNVRIRPRVHIDIYDQLQSSILKSLDYSDTEMLPTSEAIMLILMPLDGLTLGQYWASITVYLDNTAVSNRVLTFDYLERGSLRVKGLFNSISAGAWVQAGDLVRMNASFTNIGQMITTARARFEVYLDDALKEVVESDELQVDISETKDIVAYYKPEVEGRYEIKCLITYSKKITEWKSTILNVRPKPVVEAPTPAPVEAKTDYMPYILAALVVIIILLALKSFHIRRGKKSAEPAKPTEPAKA